MNKKISYILVSMLLLITSVYLMYINIFPLPSSIELPKLDIVEKIAIFELNEVSNITEKADMKNLIDYFGNAKATRTKSSNDVPVEHEYLEIKFITTDNDYDYRIYLYKKGDTWFLEQPYHGIYKLEDDIHQYLPSR